MICANFGQSPSMKLPIKGSIRDRMEIISPLVRQGKILDLGIVDSRRQKHSSDDRHESKTATSLHAAIKALNSDLLGVDIDEEGVGLLQEAGYNVKAADVITMDLPDKYDTIMAGDIIEHLPNPGAFLANMAQHLSKDGNLIITTPNPFFVKQAWKIWRYNRPQVHEEHTCWFCPITLSNLCTMSGLKVREIYWIRKPGQWIRTGPQYIRNHFSSSFLLVAGIS